MFDALCSGMSSRVNPSAIPTNPSRLIPNIQYFRPHRNGSLLPAALFLAIAHISSYKPISSLKPFKSNRFSLVNRSGTPVTPAFLCTDPWFEWMPFILVDEFGLTYVFVCATHKSFVPEKWTGVRVMPRIQHEHFEFYELYSFSSHI